MAPLIAIVGRPNVGKSTLYNRLVKGRSALVHDTPGLTRDRRYGEVSYQDVFFNLVDTGGLDLEASKDVIHAGIHRQAMSALQESDGILFVLDGRAGVTAIEQNLADLVRKLGKPVLVVANKIDSPKRDTMLSELYALGLGEVHPISAAHGTGIDDLLESLEAQVPQVKTPRVEQTIPEGAIRIALIGKPNAGKSSILNRLVGSERSLVHHAPGTTTDPVDTVLTMGDQTYVVVDTAGIRRRARVHEDIEKLSVVMALDQIRKADVVVLVIDASIGPSEQDARLCGEIAESGRGLVVAVNKADLLDGAGAATALKQKLSDELYFFEHAPFHLMSAKRGDGTDSLLDQVKRVYVESHKRVPTGELNRFFAEVVESHPPPTFKGKSVSIQYLTQPRVKPPTFLLFANRADGVQPAYRRYVENQLRKRYGYKGVPLRILARGKAKKSPSGSRSADPR